MFYNKKKQAEMIAKWSHYSLFYKSLRYITWILKLKRNSINKIIKDKHVKVSSERLVQIDIEESKTEVYKK